MEWGEKYKISFKIMSESRDLERGAQGMDGPGGVDGGERRVIISVEEEDEFPGRLWHLR